MGPRLQRGAEHAITATSGASEVPYIQKPPVLRGFWRKRADFKGQPMSDSEEFSRRGRIRPSSPAAKARLAQALRENLQRRKAQARGQDEQEKTSQDQGPEDKNGDRG